MIFPLWTVPEQDRTMQVVVPLASFVLLILVAGVGVGYILNTSQSSVATNVQTDTVTRTLLNQSAITQTYVEMQSTTTTSSYTKTSTLVFSPFNGPGNYTWYLDDFVGCSLAGSTYTPCWSVMFNQSHIFNCLAEASTQAGCTQEIVNSSNPDVNYTVTIWYPPLANQNATNYFSYDAYLANCVYGEPRYCQVFGSW